MPTSGKIIAYLCKRKKKYLAFNQLRGKYIFRQLVRRFTDFRRNKSAFMPKNAHLRNISCGKSSSFDNWSQVLPIFDEIIVHLCKININKCAFKKILATRKVYISTVNYKKSRILPIFDKTMYLRKIIIIINNNRKIKNY